MRRDDRAQADGPASPGLLALARRTTHGAREANASPRTPRDRAGSGLRPLVRFPLGEYAFAIEWRALASELGRPSGARILDVGCGSGRFMRRLEEAGALVVGVDVDAGVLEVARTRVRGPLLRADASRLPFADAAFDISIAVTVLEFICEPRRVLEEMARVTRPTGRLVIGALSPTSPWGLAHRPGLGAPPWTGVRFTLPAPLARRDDRQGARPRRPARRGRLSRPHGRRTDPRDPWAASEYEIGRDGPPKPAV